MAANHKLRDSVGITAIRMACDGIWVVRVACFRLKPSERCGPHQRAPGDGWVGLFSGGSTIASRGNLFC